MHASDLEQQLIAAYERMSQRLQLHLTPHQRVGLETLKTALETVKQQAIDLKELSQEEAEKIAAYLERDVRDTAAQVLETGHALQERLQFDWSILQQHIFDWLAQVSDPSREALIQLAAPTTHFHTGVMVGGGTLMCCQCHQQLHFKRPGHLPPCPQCHHTEFSRLPLPITPSEPR